MALCGTMTTVQGGVATGTTSGKSPLPTLLSTNIIMTKTMVDQWPLIVTTATANFHCTVNYIVQEWWWRNPLAPWINSPCQRSHWWSGVSRWYDSMNLLHCIFHVQELWWQHLNSINQVNRVNNYKYFDDAEKNSCAGSDARWGLVLERCYPFWCSLCVALTIQKW